MCEFNYVLDKQQFQDSIRQRYRRSVSGLPLSCLCGEGFNIQCNIFCKKRGFITLRHYEVKYITATLLLDVCKDVLDSRSLSLKNQDNSNCIILCK